MTDQDWIALFNEHSSSVTMLWTVYVLVVALVVGFVAQKKNLDDVKWFLIGAFLLFAFANLLPMVRAQETLVAIHRHLPSEARAVIPVWSACAVALVHLVMDCIVVLFLFGWRKHFDPTVDRPSSRPKQEHVKAETTGNAACSDLP